MSHVDVFAGWVEGCWGGWKGSHSLVLGLLVEGCTVNEWVWFLK